MGMGGQPLQAQVGQGDESGIATEGLAACLCGMPPLTSSCTVSVTLGNPLFSFACRMLLLASVGWRSWDSSSFVEITGNPLCSGLRALQESSLLVCGGNLTAASAQHLTVLRPLPCVDSWNATV